MAYIEWSDSFSVKVRELDDQHKLLVRMINTLHQAMLDGKGIEAQKTVIGELIKYTGIHFETEEKYMRRFNYPDYEAHKREHEEFAARTIELKNKVERLGFVITMDIVRFLKEWLENHLLGTDKKYSQHFTDYGLR